MEDRKKIPQLPEEFRSCFWDTDFEKLDIRKNRLFIISRLYTKGGFPGIFWVHDTYSDQDVIDAAKTRRDLNPIVANYLCEKYGLKREEMKYYQMREQQSLWR